MKLYGKSLSRSFRCIWAAEEAGLQYDYIEVDFGGKGKNGTDGEFYRQMNAQGKVPTLIDGNLVLTESGAIVNYLATRNLSAGLIPVDGSVLRAKYDQLAFFVLSELEQPIWTNGKHRFAIPEEHRVRAVLATATWEFEKAQNALVRLIGASPDYAVGDQFTMVDILIAHTLSWAERFKFDVFEGLRAYQTRMYARPACQTLLSRLEL